MLVLTVSSVRAPRVVPGVCWTKTVLRRLHRPRLCQQHVCVAEPAFCPETSSQLLPQYSKGQEPRLFSQMGESLPLPVSSTTSSSQIQELGSQVTSPQSPHLKSGLNNSRGILMRLSGVGAEP